MSATKLRTVEEWTAHLAAALEQSSKRSFNQYVKAAMALDKLGWEGDESEVGAAYRIATSWGANHWEALGKRFRSKALRPFLLFLQHGESNARSWATDALGAICDKAAVEPLIKTLKTSSDNTVRNGAALALGKLGGGRAKEALEASLKTTQCAPDGLCFLLASEALNGEESALEHLISLLEHRNESVRKEAGETLGDIGDPRAIGPLVDASLAAPMGGGSLLGSLSEAMKKVDQERALEVLIERLKGAGDEETQAKISHRLWAVSGDGLYEHGVEGSDEWTRAQWLEFWSETRGVPLEELTGRRDEPVIAEARNTPLDDQAQPEEKHPATPRRPSVPARIAGSLLLIVALFWLLSMLVMYTDTAYSTPAGQLGDPAMMATYCTVAVFFVVTVAVGLPLLLGRSKRKVMYLVNALFLAAVTVSVHPWSRSPGRVIERTDLGGGVYLDVRSFTNLDFIVLVPCIGAIVFGLLGIRASQAGGGLRTVFWLCAGVGAAGTLAFLGAAARFL